MKARLGAYAYWQLRDFLFERAAAIVVVGLLLVFSVYESIGPGAARLIAAGGRDAIAFGARGVAQHLEIVWFFCALIAIHGISANDRTSGRYRLIFAKPVRVLPYYAQAFALHGVMFMLCVLVGLAALSQLLPISGQTMGDATIILLCGYLLVGGIGFLFSAIWRFDWIGTVGVWGAMIYLASKFPHAAWLAPLPPFAKIEEQIDLLKALYPIDPKALLSVAAYGVACFLLGLIILKRRPLAT